MMVPAAFVEDTVNKLAPLLDRGDTIIDGGNSWYRDDIDRSVRSPGTGASTTSTSVSAVGFMASNAATA